MNNRLLMIIILAILVLGLNGCESMGTSDEGALGGDAQTQFEQLAKEAEAAYQQALGVDNVWRDTAEKLDEAKKAAKSGDYDKAIALAKEVKDESLLAVEQAKQQKNAGPTLF